MIDTNENDNYNENHLVTPNLNIIKKMKLFMFNVDPNINKS